MPATHYSQGFKMKYCLSALNTELEGYTNLLIYPKQKIDILYQTKIEDAEATELICENVLEYIDYSDYATTLAFLSRKARSGCKIVLSVINGRRVSDHLYFNELSNDQANKLLYGENPKIPVKSVIVDSFDFIDLLSQHGIKMIQVRHEDYREVYVCQKQ